MKRFSVSIIEMIFYVLVAVAIGFLIGYVIPKDSKSKEYIYVYPNRQEIIKNLPPDSVFSEFQRTFPTK